MSIKEAVSQIFEAEEELKTGMINGDMKCMGVARVGFSDQKIVSGSLSDFLNIDMGAPLHSFIICNQEIHEIEKEMYDFFGNKA